MIDLIKQWFCKHEFVDISGCVKVWGSIYDKRPIGFERTFVCKKCLKKKKIEY